MGNTGRVISAMIDYYAGDARRINHFLKVYGFAKSIGEVEGLDGEAMEILEVAAVTHDIGIRNSERKYGSADGSLQQTEGPPEAEKMLKELGFPKKLVDRVCWLIAHHHTYVDVEGQDYQILLEADFLVNAFEGEMSAETIREFRRKIFRTKTGIRFLEKLYPKAFEA